MRKILNVLSFSVLVGVIIYSCERELSCENCKGNKPPIPDAGADITIALPKDSVILDGSGSTDPDGTIVIYKWAKITGPFSANIVKADSSKTLVKALVAGIYQIELTVTDNGGLSAKDTLQVIVIDPIMGQPPVACAGVDQVITSPNNVVNLDGSCSADPDNNITTYNWKNISTLPANITTANAIQTQVIGLVQGVYRFELKVTDANGLFSMDTIQVTVNAGGLSAACSENRPNVYARLIQVGQLSQPRSFVSVLSAGNKIFFAGGSIWPEPPFASSRIDIYDISTATWSTAELSKPRWQIAAVAAGNKVFFAGGGFYDDADNGSSYNTVDIFDVTTSQWTTASLSGRRHNVAAAAVGDKVFFAGGRTDDFLDSVSNKVDIYNLATNTWSLKAMSQPRDAHTAVSLGSKVYFAGGITGWIPRPNDSFEYIVSNKIDVFDNATNSWSTAFLNEAKYYFAGIAVGTNIYWAGGSKGTALNKASCNVEITNVNTRISSIEYLSRARNFFVDGGQNAVIKDDQIVFFTGERVYSAQNNTNKFDIYNTSTNTWSLGVLPQTIQAASIISVNNTIYVTDGRQVWKLEF